MRVDNLIKQKSYEHLVLLLRRARIVFVGYVFAFAALLAIPVAVAWVLATYFWSVLTHPVGYPVLVLAGAVYLFSLWLFFFTQFVDFYLDVWIITNDRIVNIEQQGLFARTVSELDLYKVQDVTSDVRGVIPTFFNFGNVYIQTAGNVERFVFRQIPHPHTVRQRIADLIAEDRKYHAMEAATTRAV